MYWYAYNKYYVLLLFKLLIFFVGLEIEYLVQHGAESV